MFLSIDHVEACLKWVSFALLSNRPCWGDSVTVRRGCHYKFVVAGRGVKSHFNDHVINATPRAPQTSILTNVPDSCYFDKMCLGTWFLVLSFRGAYAATWSIFSLSQKGKNLQYTYITWLNLQSSSQISSFYLQIYISNRSAVYNHFAPLVYNLHSIFWPNLQSTK